MNKGYTIAELLITLGIIAVISVLLGASIVKLQPDQSKIKYLKRYDAITEAISEFARSSRFFPLCQNTEGEEKWNCGSHPLFNTTATWRMIGGDGKLCNALSQILNEKSMPNLNCDSQPLSYSNGNWTPSFVTTNGTEWLVSTTRSVSNNVGTYQTDIYFDINGSEGPNCLYSDSCKKPDRFKIMVAADGTVQAADPVGIKYLESRKNLRKQNLEIAAGLNVKEQLNENLRSFRLEKCEKTPKELCEEAGNIWENNACKTREDDCTSKGGTWTGNSCSMPQKEEEYACGDYYKIDDLHTYVINCMWKEYIDGQPGVKFNYPFYEDVYVTNPFLTDINKDEPGYNKKLKKKLIYKVARIPAGSTEAKFHATLNIVQEGLFILSDAAYDFIDDSYYGSLHLFAFWSDYWKVGSGYPGSFSNSLELGEIHVYYPSVDGLCYRVSPTVLNYDGLFNAIVCFADKQKKFTKRELDASRTARSHMHVIRELPEGADSDYLLDLSKGRVKPDENFFKIYYNWLEETCALVDSWDLPNGYRDLRGATRLWSLGGTYK